MRLGRPLVPLELTTEEQTLLESWARRRTTAQALAQRVRWLNLVERWFALLTQKQIKRGAHRSTRELERAIRCVREHHERSADALHLDEDRRPDSRQRGAIL